MPTLMMVTSPDTGSAPTIGRPRLMTAVAAVGFGLNCWAWLLLASLDAELWSQAGIGPVTFVLLAAVPIAIGSLGRIPVGALTDRYGPRVMFPAVSLVAALPVLAFAALEPLPAVIAAGCAAGIGGAALPVGAALVSDSHPSRRRGLAAGILGAGTIGGALATTANAHWFGPNSHRPAALLLAGLLVGYAVLSATVIPDTRARREATGAPAPGSSLRRCCDVLRLPAGRRLTVIYAVTSGALAAFALSLPAFLYTAYGLSWSETVAPTMVFIAVAAAGRMVGGWMADREDPVRILVVCGVAGAALALLLALHPAAQQVAAGAVFGLALCVGTASGVKFALICKLAPQNRTGTVAGVVAGVGGLGGVLLPLALSGGYEVEHSYSVGLTILAGLMIGIPVYLRAKGGWTGATLGLLSEAPESGTATSLIVLTAADGESPDVVAQVADVAIRDELIVVYGSRPASRQTPPHRLVATLRARLPRHSVVALLLDGPSADPSGRGRSAEIALLRDLVDAGTVPVVVTSAASPQALATEIADQLGVDRVLRVVHRGGGLRPVWDRARAASLSGTG